MVNSRIRRISFELEEELNKMQKQIEKELQKQVSTIFTSRILAKKLKGEQIIEIRTKKKRFRL